jgi:hypothetical protein
MRRHTDTSVSEDRQMPVSGIQAGKWWIVPVICRKSVAGEFLNSPLFGNICLVISLKMDRNRETAIPLLKLQGPDLVRSPDWIRRA